MPLLPLPLPPQADPTNAAADSSATTRNFSDISTPSLAGCSPALAGCSPGCASSSAGIGFGLIEARRIGQRERVPVFGPLDAGAAGRILVCPPPVEVHGFNAPIQGL